MSSKSGRNPKKDPLPPVPTERNAYENLEESVYERIDEGNVCPTAKTLKDAKVTLHKDNVNHQVGLSCLKELLTESPLYSRLNRSDPMGAYSTPRGPDPNEEEKLYSSTGDQLQPEIEGQMEVGGGKKRKRKTVRKSKKSKSVRKHKKTGKKHAKRHSKTMKRKGKQHHKRTKKHHKKNRK